MHRGGTQVKGKSRRTRGERRRRRINETVDLPETRSNARQIALASADIALSCLLFDDVAERYGSTWRAVERRHSSVDDQVQLLAGVAGAAAVGGAPVDAVGGLEAGVAAADAA